jgi:hypothetical protein
MHRMFLIKRVAQRRAGGPEWPAKLFRFSAIDFLGAIGRLQVPPPAARTRYEDHITEFIEAQRQGHWQSEVTCHGARWQVERFLKYLEHRNVTLADVDAGHVDAFFQHIAQSSAPTAMRATGSRESIQSAIGTADATRRPQTHAMPPRSTQRSSGPLRPNWNRGAPYLGKHANASCSPRRRLGAMNSSR